MAQEQFIHKRFNNASLKLIEQANAILEEYQAQGFTMTLRQLHYQFVSRDLFANTKQNYKRLGNVMSDARLAGMVDWDMMEDRVRELERQPRWDSPADIVEACAEQYRQDLWEGQKYRPEVWIEKDALGGVIAPTCKALRVDYFACRGYVSQSAQYQASKRFREYMDNGQMPIVFHLGDHDPSGLDMTRENEAKFRLLTGEHIEVRRLALNIDQVREYNPPPNFAKMTDTRAHDYVRRYGNQSWELDALDPTVIANLIRSNIEPLITATKWNRAKRNEEKQRNLLNKVALNWADITADLT